MTDAEILKRLAEIEGWKWIEEVGSYRYIHSKDYLHSKERWYPVNPLEDWSDLGPLIERHKIWLEWQEYPKTGQVNATVYGNPKGTAWHTSLPHAICLAIIEASSDETVQEEEGKE